MDKESETPLNNKVQIQEATVLLGYRTYQKNYRGMRVWSETCYQGSNGSGE